MLYGKNAAIDLQMKPVALIIKEDKQVINQKSDLNNFLILDLQKRLVKLMELFLRGGNEKMILKISLRYIISQN